MNWAWGPAGEAAAEPDDDDEDGGKDEDGGEDERVQPVVHRPANTIGQILNKNSTVHGDYT